MDADIINWALKNATPIQSMRLKNLLNESTSIIDEIYNATKEKMNKTISGSLNDTASQDQTKSKVSETRDGNIQQALVLHASTSLSSIDKPENINGDGIIIGVGRKTMCHGDGVIVSPNEQVIEADISTTASSFDACDLNDTTPPVGIFNNTNVGKSQKGEKIHGTKIKVNRKKKKIETIVQGTQIKLTQIDESTNYFDEKGYVYTTNNSNPNLPNMYFRCKNSKYCKARANAKNKNLNQAILTRVHAHTPHETVLHKNKFDKKLVKVIEKNKFLTTRQLYLKAREDLPADEAKFIPLRKSYGSFIHREKRKFIPNIPHSIDEFEQLINDEKYKQRYCFDKRNNIFYRGVWIDNNGNRMIVFISETALQELMKLKIIELLMDGTFKVLPRHIKFCQLYIMSFAFENRCYPFAYIFMEKRDATAYECLLENLVSLMTVECAEKVTVCMTDYEAAIRKVLGRYFPKARISGCLFHYVKAINKQARRFGLAKDERFAQPIREICALALLPNDFVSEGFEIIYNSIETSPQWERFTSYWDRQWLEANISVYGLKNRSNNFSESHNKSLGLLNGRRHQDIWIVIKDLILMEMDKTDELIQHIPGKMFKKKSNKPMEKLNEKILEATTRFEETENIERFLKNVTYELKDVLEQDDLDEDEDEDEHEGEDEMFLPNHFDENCNFVRKQKPVLQRKRKSTSIDNGEDYDDDADFIVPNKFRKNPKFNRNQKPKTNRKRKADSKANKSKKIKLFR